MKTAKIELSENETIILSLAMLATYEMFQNNDLHLGLSIEEQREIFDNVYDKISDCFIEIIKGITEE